MNLRTGLSLALIALVANTGCQPGGGAGAERSSATTASPEQTEASAAGEPTAAAEASAEPAAEPTAEPDAAPAAAAGFPPIPAGETPPDGAPSLAGFEFPSFGNVVVGQRAYFPTDDTAAKLVAGEVEGAGMSWYRGEIMSVDAAAGTALVKDPRGTEYTVPLSYILQGPAPASVQAGDIYLGERFNRAELVMVTSAEPDEHGNYPTMGLPGFMSDTVRDGDDKLDHFVPVAEGGAGANVICSIDGRPKLYRIMRRAAGSILGYDGNRVAVVAESDCVYAPLRPELTVGQTVTYATNTNVREATVAAIDPATGAVSVNYAWGSDTREDTARFASIITTPLPSDDD